MIYKSLFILVSFFCALPVFSQTEEIEEEARKLAQAQLEAYNARDIDAFLIPYSDSVKVYTYPDQFQYQGIENMRQRYAGFFKRAKKLHCELVGRTVFGNKVIDQELVTGFSDNPEEQLDAIAIYTVKYGKIAEVRFLRKN